MQLFTVFLYRLSPFQLHSSMFYLQVHTEIFWAAGLKWMHKHVAQPTAMPQFASAAAYAAFTIAVGCALLELALMHTAPCSDFTLSGASSLLFPLLLMHVVLLYAFVARS